MKVAISGKEAGNILRISFPARNEAGVTDRGAEMRHPGTDNCIGTVNRVRNESDRDLLSENLADFNF